MKESPSEVKSAVASEEVASIVWNPTVRYRFRKSPPLAPISSLINALYAFRPNDTCPLLTWLQKCTLPLKTRKVTASGADSIPALPVGTTEDKQSIRLEGKLFIPVFTDVNPLNVCNVNVSN